MAKRTGLRDRVVKAALTAADSKKSGKGPALAEGEETVGLTARLPLALHNRVRDYAHVNRVSINSLIIEGLEWAMKQKR